MSGKRIVEIVECEHGHPRDLSHGDWPTCIDPDCPGGSRRVLTEGQYVLIEKVDGEWPREALQEIEDVVYPDDILGALSDHTEGTP